MRFVEVLSIDCAHKSLAYTHAEVNVDIYKDLEALGRRVMSVFPRDFTSFDQLDDESFGVFVDGLVELHDLINGFIKIIQYGVINVLGGLNVKSCSSLFRVRCIKNTIESWNIPSDPELIVLIEDQPNIRNIYSFEVQTQLQHFYADSYVINLSPKLKNNIDVDDSISYNYFLTWARDEYDANKKHSSATFLHFIKNFNLTFMVETLDATKFKYDDLADSFMQILVILQPRYRISE